MWKNKELILCTSSGYYYNEAKTSKSKKIENVVNSNDYVIVSKINHYWGFTGFLIEPGDEPNSIFLSLYRIDRLGTKDDPIRIRETRMNDKNLGFRLKLRSTGDNPGYRKNACILSNYKDLATESGYNKYRSWIAPMNSNQDLNDTVWLDNPDSKFCKKTAQILKDAGFPDNVFIQGGEIAPLNNLTMLNEYFKRSQKIRKESKETLKYNKEFAKIDFCDTINNTFLLIYSDYGIAFNNKGLRTFIKVEDEFKPFRRTYLSLDIPDDKKKLVVEKLKQQSELNHFADFIDQHPTIFFNSNRYSIYEFLRSVSNKYRRRFIENIIRLDPNSVLSKGYGENKCYRNILNTSLIKEIDITQWKLTKQLRMNKDQIKLIKDFTNKENTFLDQWIRLRNQVLQFVDSYVNQYEHVDFTSINNTYIKAILNWYNKHPTNHWYGPCSINKLQNEDLDHYFQRIDKFWSYPQAYNIRYEYNDYLNMRSRLLLAEVINKDQYPVLPNSSAQIYILHDQLQEIINTQKSEIQKAQIKQYQKNTETLAKKWHYEDDAYTIDLVRDPMELKTEGAKLHHCVGSYVDRVIQEREYILFLRRKTAPKEPFLTVNINSAKTEIVQIHGQYNWWLGNWPDAIPFVMKWLKKIKISCSDQILLSTAQCYSPYGASLVEKPIID